MLGHPDYRCNNEAYNERFRLLLSVFLVKFNFVTVLNLPLMNAEIHVDH